MKPSPAHLASLQLELAMGLTSSLVLGEVLLTALGTLLRRLDLGAAAVFEWDEAPRLTLGLPRAHAHELPPHAAELAKSAHAGRGGHAASSEAGVHTHVFGLPRFGALVLVRRGDDLDPTVVRALLPLVQRLGLAARACADHAALASSEARYADLAQSLPVMLFEAELSAEGDARFLYASPRAESLLGLPPHELLASPDALVRCLSPEGGASLREALALAATRLRAVDVRCLASAWHGPPRASGPPAGEPRWLRVVGRPRPQAGVVRLSGHIEDVSGEVRLQRAEAEAERARFVEALLALGREPFDDLLALKRAVTARVAYELHALEAGVWRFVGDELEGRTVWRGHEHDASTEVPSWLASAGVSPLLQEPVGLRSGDRVARLAPLRALDRTLGVLTVVTHRELESEEAHFVDEAAALVTQAIERSERVKLAARHAAVLESIGDAVIVADPGARVLLVNPAAEALLGRSASECEGLPLDDLVGRGGELTGGILSSTQGQQGDRSRISLRGPHGSERLVAERVAPVREGEQHLGWVITLRDVTDEERARATLEHQHRQLRSISDALPDLLFAVSRDGVVRYTQERASDDLLAAAPREQRVDRLFEPELASRLLGAIEACLSSGDVQTVEYELDVPSGRQSFEARLARMSDTEATAIVRNVTAQKASAAHLSLLLQVQRIVSRLSTSLLSAPVHPLADAPGPRGDARPLDAIDAAIAELGPLVSADRCYVFRLRDGSVHHTHEWSARGERSAVHAIEALPAAAYESLLEPLRAGRAHFVPSVAHLPEGPEREELVARGVRAQLVVPVAIDGVLHGFVGLDNPTLSPLPLEEYASLLQLLADAIAAGQRRGDDDAELQRLARRLSTQTERQRALLELSSELSRVRGAEEVYDQLGVRVSAVLGIERLTVAEPSHDSAEHFRYRILGGASGEPHPWMERALGRTAIAEALRTGRIVGTHERPLEAFAEWVGLSETHGYRQFAVVPLLGGGAPMGTLNLGFRQPEPLSREQLDGVAQVAAVLAAHLSIQRTRAALESLNADLEGRVEARAEELRASEERFERLFREAPQAMLIVGSEQQVMQANRRAHSVFGYGDGELVGRPLAALVPLDHRHGHAGLVAGAMAAGPRSETVRRAMRGRVVGAARRDGTTFSAEIGLVPLEHRGERQVLAGVDDVSVRLAAEAQVTRSLREKETLLKEIHHRVKNNLQIISSLLMLQSEQMPSDEARRLLGESVFRVRSMALVHQQLYGVESLERIDFGEYARALAESLRAGLAPDLRLEVAVDVVEVNIELAVPLGLVLNELVTNALKYGRPRGERSSPRESSPDVRVELRAHGSALVATVADRGPGLPVGFDPKRATTLGMQLVRTLARQLRAELSFSSEWGGERGACFELRLPRPMGRSTPPPRTSAPGAG